MSIPQPDERYKEDFAEESETSLLLPDEPKPEYLVDIQTEPNSWQPPEWPETIIRKEWERKLQKEPLNQAVDPFDQYITENRVPLTMLDTRHSFYIQAMANLPCELYSPHADGRPVMSLEHGDFIRVEQRWTGWFWYGVKIMKDGQEGERGFFPINYFTRPIISTKVRPVSKFEFALPLLCMVPEDEIEIVWRLSPWWCWGRTSGGVGVFSLRMTEPIPQASQSSNHTMNSDLAPTKGKSEVTLSSLLSSPQPPSRENLPPMEIYRAVLERRTDDTRDLDFEVHDQIEIVYKYDDTWWVGRRDGKIGLVEAVEWGELRGRMIKEVPVPRQPSLVRAFWTWKDDRKGALSFDFGELIDVKTVYGAWRTGINAKGDRGYFPSNYVEPILGRRTFESD